MKHLIRAGANVEAVNRAGATALIMASNAGRYKNTYLVTKSYENVNFSGNCDIADYLIKSGANVNAMTNDHKNALWFAANNGNKKGGIFFLGQ